MKFLHHSSKHISTTSKFTTFNHLYVHSIIRPSTIYKLTTEVVLNCRNWSWGKSLVQYSAKIHELLYDIDRAGLCQTSCLLAYCHAKMVRPLVQSYQYAFLVHSLTTAAANSIPSQINHPLKSLLRPDIIILSQKVHVYQCKIRALHEWPATWFPYQ